MVPGGGTRNTAPQVLTLIAMFRLTTRQMVGELVARLRAVGYTDITAAHHPVFENIDPDGTRLTTLATKAGMTHQSISELVSGLERNGYLTRRPDPSDGRARIVCLAPKGQGLIRRATAEIAEIELAWLERVKGAGLEAEMRKVLQSGLRNSQHARVATSVPPTTAATEVCLRQER